MKIGIGEWKMRNGMKVTIAAYRPGVEYPWIGWIDGALFSHSWKEDGSERSGCQSIHDIISPWASPIATGHNPDKLTEEQVGVKDGWRLLDEDEIHDKRLTKCVSSWDQCSYKWIDEAWGASVVCTYRTRLSRSELAALDKPKKRLIRVEELPSVCWVTDGAGSSLITGRHEDNVWSHQGVRHSILAMANLGLKWSSDLRTWNSFEVEDK